MVLYILNIKITKERKINITNKAIKIFYFTLIFSIGLLSLSADTEEQYTEGKILQIDTSTSTITINLGKNKGLNPLIPFTILTDKEKELGPFSLTRVAKKSSQAQVPSKTLKLIKKGDKVKVDILGWIFEEGIKEYNNKKFDLAIKNFENVSKKISGHEPSFYNIGLCHIQKNKYSEALKSLELANDYNPYNLFTYKLIIDLCLIAGKYEEAREKINEVIERNPQDTDVHIKLGFLSLIQNDITAAVNEFTFVRNLKKDDATSRVNLAGIFIQKENFDKANEYLDDVSTKTVSDKRLDAFRRHLEGHMFDRANDNQKAQEAYAKAIELAPEWKNLKKKNITISSLQVELNEHLLNEYSLTEIALANPLRFEQSEVSKRVVERIEKEKEEEVKKIALGTTTKSDDAKKRPFSLTGELNQTFEYYDRNPSTSNPINDLNTTSNLKLEGKIKKMDFKVELESYYNRWDHHELDYFKINLKDNDNDEIDMGKFSAKNFPSLVSHPSIEQGFRWWHRFKRPDRDGLLDLPDDRELDENNIPSISDIYKRKFYDDQPFKTTEITVLSGRSEKPRNLNRPKPKNDRTYETSGQFEQITHAIHLMTKPFRFAELGVSYARVKDDENEATVSATTYPIESEAAGVDAELSLLDGKLKADGEIAWGNYDENVNSGDNLKNMEDVASLFGLEYKHGKAWEFSYDLKRIGTNFKVEGAYQTEDKITHTWVAKYSAQKNVPWTVRSINVKLEPARTNLHSGADSTYEYLTFQPKVSFNLPADSKLSFDFKHYDEDSSCKCSVYRTKTLKTNYEVEWEELKTTFKPSFTFERKDDRDSSPTDENKKEYGLTVENKSFNNLTLKATLEREIKTYVGSSDKSYDNRVLSLEAKYKIIPGRCDFKIKASVDDKAQTDTNDINLETLDITLDYTSKDNNKKLSLEYERKLNVYEPWSDTSAYKQDYTKLKYTQKF